MFVVVVGPSGSGKGTLLSALRERLGERVVFTTSCTTRAPRPGEKEGETYYYISRDEFEVRVAAGEFLEWAEYSGNLYGTLKAEIITPLERGEVVVREIEVQGARLIREALPRENLHFVFIDAGEWSEFEARITERAPISEEELGLREERYRDEITFKAEADTIISNRDGELTAATEALVELVSSYLER